MEYQKLIKDTMDKNFQIHGAKALFSFSMESGVQNITYSDFYEILCNVSKKLSQLNIESGDRVATFSSTTETHMGLTMILQYLGIVIVPIDCNLPLDERKRLLDFSDVKALFTEERYFDESFCNDKAVFFMRPGCVYELFSSPSEIPSYEKTTLDVYAILFSSGTTGNINGVEETFKSMWLTLKLMSDFTDSKAEDTYLNVLPLSHIAGYGTAFSFVLLGATICFAGDVNAQSLLKAFQTFKPTAFEMVPEVYDLMRVRTLAIISRSKPLYLYYRFATSLMRFFRKNFNVKPLFLTKPIYSKLLGPNFRGGAVGAAPVSEELMKFYLDLGVEIVNGYGSTETSFPISTTHCLSPYDYKGVGNPARYKEIEVKINDPDANGIGEIYVKTELIMKGYFKNEELTKKAFSEDGWYKTGDLGALTEDGILLMKGRIKENIVLSNGEKVTPYEIDNYYKSDDAKIACSGVTNQKGYDEIHLFIESADQKLADEAYQKSLSAPKNYKVKEIHLVDKIPVTSTGKIKRFELRGMVG